MYNVYYNNNNKFIYVEFLASKLVGFIAAPLLSLQLEMMSIFAPSLMITCTVNAFYSIFFLSLIVFKLYSFKFIHFSDKEIYSPAAICIPGHFKV